MLTFNMLHQEFEPSEELRDSIKCFWYNSRDFGEQESSFVVMPDGYAELIFLFGGPCSVMLNGGMQPLPSPFMVGLLNQPVTYFAKGRLEIIAIRCFPWTVFDLLGLPAGKDGVRIVKHPIAQLQSGLETCVRAGRIAEAVILVTTYFLEARSRVAMDSMLYKAGVAMRGAKGTMPVSEVAANAHATVRTLERKFKQSSGYSVKDVSGLMRFEQVRNRLWMHPKASLAGLAQELGYSDQAHLSKEFKRYTGTTPAAFARKAKQGKQAVSSDFVAFVQA
jgi:AraC-like DNA-binding protein